MNECSRWQAKNMAKLAGIDLSEEQTQSYISERDKTPTGKKGEESPWSCRLSDQELFNSILNEEQSGILRK